jgi:PAS domain S-box-containing protein
VEIDGPPDPGCSERERFIAAILAAFPGMIYVFDLVNNSNVFVTGRLEAILGYTPAELQAMGPSMLVELLHPDDLARARALHGRFATASDGQVLESEYRMRDKDGTWHTLNSRETVFRRDEQGRATQMLGTALDITALRESQRRLLEVQERERRHLAAELHDEIGQQLTGVLLSLNNPTPAGLEMARGLVKEITGRVRDLSLRLRPSLLDDLGLVPAVLWHLGRFTKQTGVKVALRHRRVERRFPTEVETAAYRIVQEALTNVARHGQCQQASVEMWRSGQQLWVEVADEGVGFDPTDGRALTAGLTGMRDRVEGLGGQLTIESVPGRGTCVRAAFPLSGVDSHDDSAPPGG